MDFIDDFIQEYKNNPCLWKADSIHFKNRSKRQEAYLRLIEVASKHGEHYNVERTKQKINNLRCAFRHQLKKFVEFKTKGDKDEPFCPKRRYFESLMFLKDEENPDKKLKQQNTILNTTLQCTENKQIVAPMTICTFQDANIYSNNKDTVTEIVIGRNLSFNKIEQDLESTKNKTIGRRNLCESTTGYEEEKTITYETINGTPVIDTEIEKEPADCYRKPIHRKRSSSISSDLSNETELVSTKTVKVDFNTMDFDKLFSLACKSVNSNIGDHFSNFGRMISHKLRTMDSTQAIYAEKIIADVIFQGQMKMLTASSLNQFTKVDFCNS